MWFTKETPRKHLGEERIELEAKPGFRAIAAMLVRVLKFSPALALTMAGGVATHFILGAATFDRLWLVQERGFDRAYIAQMTGWVGVAGGVLGHLFGGIGSDWWQNNRKSGRPMFLVVVLTFMVPIGFFYRIAEPGALFFWFAVFADFSSSVAFMDQPSPLSRSSRLQEYVQPL